MLTEPARNPDETHARLLARLVRELLRTGGPFASLADLTDALKVRCARLRISWTNEAIEAAYRLIDSNTDLVAEPLRLVRPAPDLRPPLSREEARAMLDHLRTAAKPMPTAHLVTQAQADKCRALQMVVDEIKRTIARCDALEARTGEPGEEG